MFFNLPCGIIYRTFPMIKLQNIIFIPNKTPIVFSTVVVEKNRNIVVFFNLHGEILYRKFSMIKIQNIIFIPIFPMLI